jgi:phosphodiesterase/alkaline phosphatase D-like protein
VDSAAYPEIAALSPDLFIHMGDLHYHDINVNDGALFDAAYQTTIGAPLMEKLALTTPIAYIYDDHDFVSSFARS